MLKHHSNFGLSIGTSLPDEGRSHIPSDQLERLAFCKDEKHIAWLIMLCMTDEIGNYLELPIISFTTRGLHTFTPLYEARLGNITLNDNYLYHFSGKNNKARKALHIMQRYAHRDDLRNIYYPQNFNPRLGSLFVHENERHININRKVYFSELPFSKSEFSQFKQDSLELIQKSKRFHFELNT